MNKFDFIVMDRTLADVAIYTLFKNKDIAFNILDFFKYYFLDHYEKIIFRSISNNEAIFYNNNNESRNILFFNYIEELLFQTYKETLKITDKDWFIYN